MLLRNPSSIGFARRTTEWDVICGGPHVKFIDAGETHYHRPADHPLGYGAVCNGCYLNLGKTVPDKPMYTNHLATIPAPHTRYTANVGSKRPGDQQDGSRVNSVRERN